MAYNIAYVEGRWGLFRHAGAMQLITRKASLPVDPKCKACPTFHIKGICNMGCGNADYHVVHTREKDLPFGDGPSGQCQRSQRPC